MPMQPTPVGSKAIIPIVQIATEVPHGNAYCDMRVGTPAQEKPCTYLRDRRNSIDRQARTFHQKDM